MTEGPNFAWGDLLPKHIAFGYRWCEKTSDAFKLTEASRLVEDIVNFSLDWSSHVHEGVFPEEDPLRMSVNEAIYIRGGMVADAIRMLVSNGYELPKGITIADAVLAAHLRNIGYVIPPYGMFFNNGRFAPNHDAVATGIGAIKQYNESRHTILPPIVIEAIKSKDEQLSNRVVNRQSIFQQLFTIMDVMEKFAELARVSGDILITSAFKIHYDICDKLTEQDLHGWYKQLWIMFESNLHLTTGEYYNLRENTYPNLARLGPWDPTGISTRDPLVESLFIKQLVIAAMTQ